ncbi:MAG: hypothetical protein IJV40_01475 [Oscillospiraceae bacterium]|nr:hypothetical protein [Oscillospiraceae bacterium]
MKEIKNSVQALNDQALEHVAGGYGGEVVSSGSFASQTGTSLNLLVSWNVTSDGIGQKTLNVTVATTSYSLYTGALVNAVELTVNGMMYLATPNAVNYGGNSLATNVLAGFSIPNVTGPASITAVWHFNGTYSGVAMNTITASGVAAF